MAIRNVTIDDVLREVWNDDASPRTVTFYAIDGTVSSTRNYTPEENVFVDNTLASQSADANREQIATKLNTAMADIQALLDTTNPTINAGPAPYIKVLARAIRLLIRMAIKRFDGNA